jgi:hypothetical protein
MQRVARTVAVALTLGGCAGGIDDPNWTGARLSVDDLAGTDVVGFHYLVERVPCGFESIEPWIAEFSVHLLDNLFPGMVDHVEPHFDPSSRHTGADLYLSLDEGCYDVVVWPASEVDVDAGTFTPSSQCSSAESNTPLQVVDGQTTESPLLVSQCS